LGTGGIAFLTLALDGGEWSASRPGICSLGESPWYPLDRRLGEPQSRSGYAGDEKNSQPLPGLQPGGVKINPLGDMM